MSATVSTGLHPANAELFPRLPRYNPSHRYVIALIGDGMAREASVLRDCIIPERLRENKHAIEQNSIWFDWGFSPWDGEGNPPATLRLVTRHMSVEKLKQIFPDEDTYIVPVSLHQEGTLGRQPRVESRPGTWVSIPYAGNDVELWLLVENICLLCGINPSPFVKNTH